jgi:hypothetical protein
MISGMGAGVASGVEVSGAKVPITTGATAGGLETGGVVTGGRELMVGAVAGAAVMG